MQHIDGGNAEHTEPQLHYPYITRGVTFGPVTAIVGFAVYFDRQSCANAGEVEHIGAERVLLAEEEAAGAVL